MFVANTPQRLRLMNLSGGYEGGGTDMNGDGFDGGDFGGSFDPEGTADANRPDGSAGVEAQGGFGGPDDFGPNASYSYQPTVAPVAPAAPAAPAAPSTSIANTGANVDPEGTADASRPDGTPGIEAQGGFGGPDDFAEGVAVALKPTGLARDLLNFLARVAVGLLFGGVPGAIAATKATVGQLAVRELQSRFGNTFAAAPGMTSDALAASVDAALSSAYSGGAFDGGMQSGLSVADVVATLEANGVTPATKPVPINFRPLPSFITTTTNPNNYYGPNQSGGGYIPAPLDYGQNTQSGSASDSGSNAGAIGVLFAIGLMLVAGG